MTYDKDASALSLCFTFCTFLLKMIKHEHKPSDLEFKCPPLWQPNTYNFSSSLTLMFHIVSYLKMPLVETFPGIQIRWGSITNPMCF